MATSRSVKKASVSKAKATKQSQSNIEDTLRDRGSKYGSFITHAQITQDLEDVMRDTAKWGSLTASQKECLHMIAHKIGRILNGDPAYVDSWTDIIGYTRLVEKELLGEKLL